TGPAGEEIFCDEHGRVRVKFNWDRYNPADQDSSCWIRVAQAWAGTGFGHLAIPRVGQEVIVDFLNGDPDQPIIMGRTYHQENRTPGSLPGTKTQMTIRSKTYMGSGFNELKFDDATGREQVYIHAQKNMDTAAASVRAPQWVTRTNHAVSDLTGRPLMLFNSEGKTVWRPGQTSLWGLALSLPADTGYPDPRGELDPEADPGLLYAGQWRDAESGLCYNRFRYYEPESGMYLVSDPLGLQGGEQTYRYVPNPLRWIDPLGLNKGASLSKMMNSSSDLMGLRRQPQNFWRLYRGKDI
ncbi:type VI secretion system tip protein TssI/VgrG, partial [Escherichia coli]|uniref:type VI secretion system tip protein TssI/VgrG n=1 Tax=Escherichia coli TaxID=562 RepID=UPI0020210374